MRQALIGGAAYGLGLMVGNVVGFFLRSVVPIPRAQSEFTMALIGVLIAFLISAVVGVSVDLPAATRCRALAIGPDGGALPGRVHSAWP